MTLKAKDIAQLIGVSPSTVSLVLNNRPGISDARKEQILSKINELDCGYMLKKNIPLGKNLGFVVYKGIGDIIGESPFFSYLLESITIRADKYGYSLIISHIEREMPFEKQIELLTNSNCEGFVVFATEMLENDLKLFKKINMPFVFLDNYFEGEEFDSISINNRQGTLKAISHLVKLGHKEIGYIKSKVFINSFGERFEGYQKALHTCGITETSNYIIQVSYSEKDSYTDMVNYLKTNPKLPTAFLADNDVLAFGVIKALKEYGYKIPQDISIIGFDDRPICMLSEPTMTTLKVPKDVFGSTAIDMLFNRIQKEKQNTFKIEVGTFLVERESTGTISN